MNPVWNEIEVQLSLLEDELYSKPAIAFEVLALIPLLPDDYDEEISYTLGCLDDHGLL